MVIAAMVNRSGLVASRKRWLDSAVASFAALAAMRRIVAADSSSASRALHAAPPATIVFALKQAQ
jgi:hypothetical protein